MVFSKHCDLKIWQIWPKTAIEAPKNHVFAEFYKVTEWLGGSVGRALARDRKVASSTPGLSATE